MNGQIDQLVKSLLQKESLEHCSLQELQQFAERHPYFGATQLLLTKKMQLERSDLYDEQLQKTYLFFHNPLWVQQLLNDTGNAMITVPEKKDNITDSSPVKTDINDFPEVLPDPSDIPLSEPVQATVPKVEPVKQDQVKDDLVFEPY